MRYFFMNIRIFQQSVSWCLFNFLKNILTGIFIKKYFYLCYQYVKIKSFCDTVSASERVKNVSKSQEFTRADLIISYLKKKIFIIFFSLLWWLLKMKIGKE